MILDIFPTPIYLERLKSYDKQSMIDTIDDIYNVDGKSFFGDASNTVQIHNHENFAWLNNQVKHHTLNYLRQSGYVDDVNVVVQKSWAVILKSGGNVQLHKHLNSHLSCVFYLQTGTSFLSFYRQPDYMQSLPIQSKSDSPYNSYEISVGVEEGAFILFPSSIPHKVNNYYEDTVRYSITYDIMITTNEPTENMVLSPTLWKSL
jgi:uncharacterized protein (TIGR02466 family)|tara:strand:- start:928 stop:1539 length:612 start_codon:yes stop_codon:yes gene_type:complete